MLIRIGFDVSFELAQPTPMLLMLYTHPSRKNDLQEIEWILCDPALPIFTALDAFGNLCGRLTAPPGMLRLRHQAMVRDSGVPDPVVPTAMQHPVSELPPETLQFLLGSRYCDTDRLSDIAWSLFGNTPLGWPRVQAVSDWVHQNVQFGYQFARSTKTAYDVYAERQGVCRDFAHLFIALVRCLNIPARYATGYLGDIGVPPEAAPMDFSAWSEVYLDNRWYTFDARHNIPRIGRIVMARGRDATDVALTTSFGSAILRKFSVTTEEVSQGFPNAASA